VSDLLPVHEIFALRYATRGGRRPEHFIGGDPHDTEMPMDYFVWVIRGAARTFVVDTGFTAAMAAKRKRTFLRCPVASLALLGIEPAQATDVILTHLHYDHVGNFDRFPAARFHLQEREMAYATGRYMKYPFFSHAFEAHDVAGMVHLLHGGRVEMYDGCAELTPGVVLHPAPGHTAGLQVVRVHTRRGWVVLASDATHYYENLRSDRPFPVALHLGEMIDSFRAVERLADSPDHIVPGHDPLVMRLYAPPAPALEGVVVQLDVAPRVLTD
jgi:glyoxylase-like metal-dependent hydrolase (beta-lactamase superfamily II)